MSTAPQPGMVLAGKYRVEEILGVGGMGAVVAAHHLQLDQKVAIKYLLPEAIKNPEVVERFAREARAAAKIRGEHVVRVIDVGHFDDGSPYMVMEYLEGHDLAKELLEKAPLRTADVARYILEACEALAEAHAARIVHRDLKPQNLFLSIQPGQRSIVKVLDFGISKVGTDNVSAALTHTSALMGTAFYMSPEQMTAPKSVDHRSDIWALGVILYELLTGNPPFVGETVAEVIAAILTNEPEGIQKLRPDVPAGLVSVIARCMQSKAADRYANVAELAAELAPFAAPEDRGSVAIIARVLGVSVERASQPEPVSAETIATATLARAAAPARTPPSGNAGEAPPESFAATQHAGSAHAATVSRPNLEPIGPVTTHALTRSASAEVPATRSKTPIVAGLIGVAVLGAGALAYALSASTPPATGVVSAPSAEVTAASTPARPSASVEGTVLLPATAESPPAASIESAAPPASAAVATPAAPTKQAPSVPTTKSTASPNTRSNTSASPNVRSSATSAPPAAPASATAASSAPKNPLQMGIK